MVKGHRVTYYVDSKGKNIISLLIKTQAKVLRIFQILEKYGLNYGIPHIKKITATELWEIRILGKDNIRFLYVTVQELNILVLHGFIKKTRKTPQKEIRTAIIRYCEWLNKKHPV